MTDKLDSVRDIVSSSGSLLDHVVYDSFGNILTETNASNGDRFTYAGMEYDSTTGQYFDNARWYGAGAGRFTTQDPMGFGAADPNLYPYAGNNATDGTDPSGMDFMGLAMPSGSDYWHFLTNPNEMDTDLQNTQACALGVAAGCLTAAGLLLAVQMVAMGAGGLGAASAAMAEEGAVAAAAGETGMAAVGTAMGESAAVMAGEGMAAAGAGEAGMAAMTGAMGEGAAVMASEGMAAAGAGEAAMAGTTAAMAGNGAMAAGAEAAAATAAEGAAAVEGLAGAGEAALATGVQGAAGAEGALTLPPICGGAPALSPAQVEIVSLFQRILNARETITILTARGFQVARGMGALPR